jgi:hypothetical protein
MASIWDLTPAGMSASEATPLFGPLWPTQPFISPFGPAQVPIWPQAAPANWSASASDAPTLASPAWPTTAAAPLSDAAPYADTSAAQWRGGLFGALASSSNRDTGSIDEAEGLAPPRDVNRSYVRPAPSPLAPPPVIPPPVVRPPIAAPQTPLWQRLARVPPALGGAAAAVAAAILLGSTTRTAKPEDDEFHPQFVIRGGLSAPRTLQDNTKELSQKGLPGQYGMSSTSAPNMKVDQLAAVARYPHPKISYTTVPEVGSLGYVVVPTPDPKNPLHATILLPPGQTELTPKQAAALSALFAQHIIDNLYQSSGQ